MNENDEDGGYFFSYLIHFNEKVHPNKMSRILICLHVSMRLTVNWKR